MATIAPFPESERDFALDERIFFSKEHEKYHLEDEKGVEWEWEPLTLSWRRLEDADGPQVSEEEKLVAQWRAQYDGNESVPTSEELARKTAEEEKRLAEKKAEEEARRQRETDQRAVYVTGLPFDTDIKEVYDVFANCGVIDESIDNDEPRIKMYYDENNEFKGEALIVFYQHAGAAKSVRWWHGKDFRANRYIDGDLKVVFADSSFRRHNAGDAPEEPATKSKDQGKKRKRMMNKDEYKAKKKAKIAQMEAKTSDNTENAQDMDNSDEYRNKWERMLIIRGMFTPEKLIEEPDLYADIKDDVHEICDEFGKITNMVIWKGEPEGVVTVRFADVDSAVECQKELNGKGYDGGFVRTSISTGYEKFKKELPSKEELDARRKEDDAAAARREALMADALASLRPAAAKAAANKGANDKST